MRSVPLRLFAAVAGLVLFQSGWAQIYKWVDGRGVTTYGEAPPAGRDARLLHLRPNVVDGGGAMRLSRAVIAAVDSAAAAAAERQPAQHPAARNVRGMPFTVYIRLSAGMTEGELVERAGPPDYAAVDGIVDGAKTFYYYPTASDPFTTAVRLRSGYVVDIKRIKKY